MEPTAEDVDVKIPKRPSLPTAVGTLPTTSREPPVESKEEERPRKKWYKHLYDRENKTFCDRTCKSWLYIISYSILYLIFLATYTMIFLCIALSILKSDETYLEKSDLYTYADNGIGLTATPTSEHSYPMIWYKKDKENDYKKYVNALEKTISSRRKRDTQNSSSLGPCGASPFGYGDSPCVVVKINRQRNWSAEPLLPSSSSIKDVPVEVQKWVGKDRKLWLRCAGFYPYDQEHIGSIKYYPDPPGYNPSAFPLDSTMDSPLLAVQFSNFTLGVSLIVECKLWYDGGTSSVNFMLFVDSSNRV